MIFWQNKRGLLTCEVIHQLPGRLRIHSEALRYLGPSAAEIELNLGELDGFKSVSVSSITANILVYYDVDRLTGEEVFELVENIIGQYALHASQAEREERAESTVIERRLQEEPVSEILKRVGITAASLALAVLRKSNPTSSAFGFFGRFLTMPALTAISLSLPIFRSGWQSLLRSGRPNADTLTSAAIMSSLLAGRDRSALTIIWLADLAELLTVYTMDRTRRAITDMMSTGQGTVWRLDQDDQPRKVPLEDIVPGDRLAVHTGEKIGVDGIVLSGQAAVDQASITGEFLPMSKGPDDTVYAGTVVKNGQVVIRAERVGDDTAVARIVHLVENAANRKAAIQSFADRFSGAAIPLNFALGALVYFVTGSTQRALNMLVIDYSCGVRLSTATALSAAICTNARQGVLIKGGNYIESLAEIDTLIFDKTGTITSGQPEVTSVYSLEKRTRPERVLELAAAAEETSSHPMANAVLKKMRREQLRIPAHSETKTVVARGVETRVGKNTVRVGNRRYMEESGIDPEPARERVSKLVRRGENVLYVARDKRVLGVIGIQDSLRENMKKALNRLRNLGMDDIVLLTGDVEQHAEIVADRMAMDRFEAEVLPEDKAETVLRLQSKGVRVGMVGDGINDAPALAYADVGLAMGGAKTDIAMETADITLAGDDPLMIPGVIRLAQETMGTVRQNFGIVIGVNTLGLLLGALGVLTVFWGAVLHNSCTVAVVLNSARLLFYDLQRGR